MSLLVAAAQPEIIREQEEANAPVCLRLLRDISSRGAGLALLPEMTLTGFTMNAARHAQSGSASPAAELFSSAARELGMAVGFGWIEALGGKYYNKYSVVSGSGELIADYAKLHPFSFGGEDRVYASGSSLSSFQLSGVSVGLTVCYDLRFPELYQALCRDCQLICVAANWPAARQAHFDALLTARAIETQCFIAASNIRGVSGPERYTGGSCVISPAGERLSSAGVDGLMAIASVAPEDVLSLRESFPVERDRRHELYKSFYS